MECALVTDAILPWLKRLAHKTGIGVYRTSDLRALQGDVRVLIRWGTTRGTDDGFERVINRQRALRIVYDPETALRRLYLNGLQPMTKRAAARRGDLRLYRVEVFDLCPFHLRRLVFEGGHWRLRQATGMTRRDRYRAMSAAVRALHALGLDSGRADVVLLPAADGLLREGVCAVNPAPDWSGPLFGCLVSALLDVLQSVDAAPAWRLGADPELVFMSPRGDFVPASRFLPRDGPVGCDSQTMPGQAGVRPLAELRPKPHRTPEALVEELRDCLGLLRSRVTDPDLIWCAGSQPFEGYGLGGHVHLSGGRLSGPLLRALDTYLAVPVMLVESPAAAAARRRRHGYLGDVRFKDHGGFEYRTLPSWLVSPRMAHAVLSLAAWIACEYRRLTLDLFLDTELVQAFYRSEKDAFYTAAERIIEELYATPSRWRFGAAVEPLFDMIVRRQVWDDAADIRRTWLVVETPGGEEPAAATLGVNQ